MPKFRDSSWADFSAKVCKLHGLPEGFHLRVFPKGSSRQKRSDFTVSRLPINRKNVGWLNDDERVSRLREECILLLEEGSLPHGAKVLLFDGTGKEISGGTNLGTLRPTKEVSTSLKLSQSNFDDMEYLRPLVLATISNLEDGISEPDYSVVGAILRGLSERYGREHVKTVFELV